MSCANGSRVAQAGPPPAGVRGNDWRAVAAAPTAAFAPIEAVSVVLPCHGAARALERTLAAFARQDYPSALLEAVVVDDGSEPPLAVPAGMPFDVRVVRQSRRRFGLARARNRGAREASHDILVFLDADLLAEAGLVRAHARWHHAVADAVTLGFCAYVDILGIDAADLRGARGPLRELLAKRPCDRPWTERHMARSDDLLAPCDDLFRAVVGNNLGIRRGLFEALGGFDASFDRYGWEDTEFGWRAQTQGALLVPERGALAWHQGRFAQNRSQSKRRDTAAQAAKGGGLIAHPDFRRPCAGLPVPRTAVAVRPAAAGAAATVERLLAGDDPDLAVLAETGGSRREADRLRDLARRDARLRVVTVADPAATFPAAAFLVELTPGAMPEPALLARLRAGLGTAAVGTATLPDGSRARIARAWAVHRARRAGGRPQDYGVTVAFALRRRSQGGSLARRALGWLQTAGSRPRAGVARLLAELGRARGPRDLARLAAWLRRGLAWRLGLRRGLVGARLGRSRAAALAALARRRARRLAPSDLAAAARLLAAGAPRGGTFGQTAARLARRASSLANKGHAPDRTRARLRPLVSSLLAQAPDGPRAGAAKRVADALASGDADLVARLSWAAGRAPDLGAEKIVSHRHGFVWVGNPKAASRSLIRALLAADPEALLVREVTLAEVYAALPEARGYFSFAFVRHPVGRALSCHAEKVQEAGSIDLSPFPGLAAGMDLEAFCAWLGSPWGADAFADRHWLSQDLLLRAAPDAPLPDFIGRFERLDADFACVAARLGLPPRRLPHRNPRPAAVRAPSPSAAALDALTVRYARDLNAFGYHPPAAGDWP